LKAVAQHRPVDLGEDVVAHLDNSVGSDAEDVGVVGGVADFAHGLSVWHQGIAVWVVVGQDVCGVEQGWVA
jgi:hypothetical protein